MVDTCLAKSSQDWNASAIQFHSPIERRVVRLFQGGNPPAILWKIAFVAIDAVN
jgi:hypothetical protein